MVCPYHSDKYRLWIYENEKESFDAAVELDEKVRSYSDIDDQCFVHRSCRPLKEVIIDIKKGKELAFRQLNFFPELIDECSGICAT